MTTENHAFTPEEVMAYLDAELPADQRKAVSRHLEQCAECRGLVADFRSVSQKMASWEIESSQLDAPLPASVPFWRRGWVIATAAAMVIVFLGISVRWNHPQHMAERAPRAFHQLASLQDSAPAHRVFERAAAPVAGPLIVRTANLTLIANNFDNVRTQIEQIISQHRGYIGQLELNSANGAARSLTASLRVPAEQLDAVMKELKPLGQVRSESQSGEDVTQRSTDLDARLANLHVTEQRLQQLLRDRTGKLSDVLEVEEAVDRTRGEIETAEAERKLLSSQIAFSSLQLTVSEEYKAPVEGADGSAMNRLRNASVDGYHNAIDVMVNILVVMLSIGPALLIISVIALPAVLWYRRKRLAR
jgi:hypothetical protein